jgi:hypothetical protein
MFMFKRLIERIDIFEINKSLSYYQLSKKQEILWALGIFLAAIIFSFIMELFMGAKYPFGAFTIAYTILVITFSFTMALPFFGFCFFIKKSKIIIYQIWTICLTITMIGLIFKIDLSRTNLIFKNIRHDLSAYGSHNKK